jgi:uncharacterized protein YcbX
MTTLLLKDIFIYPVKSLAGIRVAVSDVVATGLRYDRQWMLVDEQGEFLSQRRMPKMALIQTQLTSSGLILSAEGQSPLHIPTALQSDVVINVRVWADFCLARHVSAEADTWLSHFLGSKCRLVFLPDSEKRPVDLNYALPQDQTAFSDGFPFLIVSDNSLQVLNQAMAQSVEMVRFRPNLVIAGCNAFAEDSWRDIRVGSINFRLPKPCSRCAIPAINPQTGHIEKEPLATLNRFRKWQNKIYFGQNALHNQLGQLRVGNQVEVITSGEKQPPMVEWV